MGQLVYDPDISGQKMTIVCFVSGSGTNYREIVAGNCNHKYIVFTNRPGCSGIEIARRNNHDVIELSHIPYLRVAVKKYGVGNVPRNCPERVTYEKEITRLLQSRLGKDLDLLCLAGYDQWLSDWMVEKYYPRILNVHPGDTTKGYDGLHWIPLARALLAGDDVLRSTLFFADKDEDTGPVLAQSAPLCIIKAITELKTKGENELVEGFYKVVEYSGTHGMKTFEDFRARAGEIQLRMLELVCKRLQDALKVAGDWKIYPFGVHELIAKGRVGIANREVYIDGRKMPGYGYRLDSSSENTG
jgi:folate-dependent phosphoribosylglycinamide formyltransferase PurN